MTKMHAPLPLSPKAGSQTGSQNGRRPPTSKPSQAEAPPAMASGIALRDALVDSRQRFRDLVALAADFAFETDATGRFVFVSPDPALGWHASALLGQTGDLLLGDADGGAFDPFRAAEPVRRRQAWLKRPDGRPVCVSFSVAPVIDEDGRVIGARGIGQDVTEEERRGAAVAGTLRRSEVIDHILTQMRKEVLAPRMMLAVLGALSNASGSEGLAVVDLLETGAEPTVLHSFGQVEPSAVVAVSALLREDAGEEPVDGLASDGRLVLVCPTQTRFGDDAALVMWRRPGARAWDDDERQLASSGTAIVRMVLEHEAIQREMARQARTDPLTGLLNRRAFMDELTRRFSRLEVAGMPGTLVFVDLDNFKALNDSRGHDVGDEALRAAASVMRTCCRPTDLVARLGGDEFALWLDGADQLAAAERAEQLRTDGPVALAHFSPPGVPPITLSIGLAGRWPGNDEDAEALLGRADRAMYEVKRNGRGHWRVAPSEADS